MNPIETWSSLFSHSSFFCIKKNEELTASLLHLHSRLDYKNIEYFHQSRKKEFLLRRLCASRAHHLHFGK